MAFICALTMQVVDVDIRYHNMDLVLPLKPLFLCA